MRKWIQHYLGIEQVMLSNVLLTTQINELKYKLGALNSQMGDINSTIAGALQKLELDEFSEARRNNSDAIAKQTALRLWGEQAARDHTEGKPIAPKPKI